MIKVFELPQVDKYNRPTVRDIWTPESNTLNKYAGDADLHPTMKDFISGIKSVEKHTFKLITALGAAEYWGQNRNGDRFYEKALLLPGPKYGYSSFLTAGVYFHHQNKDPNKSVGKVIFSHYNPTMHRVELVIDYDHALLEREGKLEYLNLLNPDYSMAAKVPWDECFVAGTLVRTTLGNVPIENISAGDRVLTHTGDVKVVTSALKRNHTGSLVTIKVVGSPPMTMTGNHPVLVLSREYVRSCNGTTGGSRCRHQPLTDGTCGRCKKFLGWTPEWRAADAVVVGDYLLSPVRKTRTIPTSEDVLRARVLGYYLGDGHLIRYHDKDGGYVYEGVSFSVGSDESEHLAKLCATLVGVCGDKVRVYDASNGKRAKVVNVYDQGLACWILETAGVGCRGKYLDESVYSWSENERLNLLGAYIDTDGCADEKQVRISTVNRGLALDVQRLAQSLDISASIISLRNENTGYNSNPVIYHVSLPGSSSKLLQPYAVKIKENPAEYSASQLFRFGDFWCAPVNSIEETIDANVEVFNLSVEGDESYVAEGLIVHNCTICCDEAEVLRVIGESGSDKPEDQVKYVLEYIKTHPIRGLATRRENYCEHLRHMMNDILSGSRKVGARNRYPEFFDISQVHVGAATEAKEMLKVAHVGYTGAAELAELWGMNEAYETKLAGVSKVADLLRTAAMTRVAEIDKYVDGVGIPLHVSQEKDIPQNIPVSVSLPQLLSTMGGMGMIMSPSEFQFSALSHAGKGDLAHELASKHVVFPPTSSPGIGVPVGPEHFLSSLVTHLLPLLENRSCLSPVADRRMAILVIKGKGDFQKKAEISTIDYRKFSKEQCNTLNKIAALYKGYREQLAINIVPLVRCASGYPGIREALYSDALVSDGFEKGATSKAEVALLGSLYPILYLYAAHLRNSEKDSEKLGIIRKFLKEHPFGSATGLAALLYRLAH